jgi:hypothetical protein
LSKIALVAVAATLIASAAVAQTPVTEKEVSPAVGKILAFEPKDAFDEAPNRAVAIGKPYRLSVKIEDGNSHSERGFSVGGYWTYDRDKHVLSLKLSPTTLNMLSRANETPSVEGFGFDGLPRVVGAPHEAMNGYGAKVMVTHMTTATMVVGQTSAGYDPSRSLRHLRMGEDLSLEPDAARDLVTHLVMVVEGTTKAFDGTHDVTCETRTAGATVQSPTELSMKTCALTGHVDRVSFQRSDTGQVLKEWANPLD